MLLALAVFVAQRTASGAPAVRLVVSNSSCLIRGCPPGFPPPSPIVASGAPSPIYVAAFDANGLIDATFTGTVSFATSDQKAFVPPPYTFAPTDFGGKAFSVVLVTPGPQTISVSSGGLAGGSLQLTVLESAGAIPTLSEIGVAMLALSIAVGGLVILRRQSV